tara:strand:+ start:359 stop:613 length:255 start_codon:yes stop_codon:yes gene_type:complete
MKIFQIFLAFFYIRKSFFDIMRRRHMLGTHDRTLCGWSVTTGELAQMKKMDDKYVNCKRCLEKLNAVEAPSLELSKNKRAVPNV